MDLLRWAGVQVTGDLFIMDSPGSPWTSRRLSIFGVPPSCGGQGPVIFIDGRQWDTEVAMMRLELADPREILGVEVYRHLGGLPVEYNVPNAQCGVVAFWLRP